MEQARFGLVRDIASDPDWRAKLAILERTDPDRFGRVTRSEVTGAGGGPIQGAGFAPAVVNVIIEKNADQRPEEETEGEEEES